METTQTSKNSPESSPVMFGADGLMQQIKAAMDRLAAGESFAEVEASTGVRQALERALARQDEPVYFVVQEGGSSTELYVHGFDAAQDAQDYRKSCHHDGSYRTSSVVEVPRAMADSHPGAVEALQALVMAGSDLDYPDDSEDESPAG